MADRPLFRRRAGQDLANLCLRLALSRVPGARGGSGASGFPGFDEIPGSQDSQRREDIMAAFTRLQDFPQVMIISHLDDIRQVFPQIIEVTGSEATGSEAN